MTAPAPFSTSCPSCGAPIRFRWAQAVQTTCDFCKSVLVRQGLDLTKVGQQADFPVTASPIQLGVEARWGNRTLVVVGRLSYEWTRGRWNEWFCRVSDGSSAWLSDAQLEYAITTQVDVARPLPDPSSLSVGDVVNTDDYRYTVAGLSQATYIGTEGELPFTTSGREHSWFADLLDASGGFATIDGSESPPLLFVGEYVTWTELQATGAREFEGW
jgi:hypothetical protein